MRRAYAVIAAAAVAALLSPAPAGADQVGTHKVFLPGDTPFVAGPASLPGGAEAAVLYGDPAKEGLFVMRLKAPKGYRIPPHTHPKAEVVSVVAGRMRLGLGPAADRASVEELPRALSRSCRRASRITLSSTRRRCSRSTPWGRGASITSVRRTTHATRSRRRRGERTGSLRPAARPAPSPCAPPRRGGDRRKAEPAAATRSARARRIPRDAPSDGRPDRSPPRRR